MKTLKAVVTRNDLSYVVNENGNGQRVTLQGYGSCTPVDILQETINKLTPNQFEAWWQDCEKARDNII